MFKRTVQVAVIAALTFAFVAQASAMKCAGVELPDKKTVDGQELVLNGMGIREATIFSVNVYVAGLWVKEKSSDGNAIASSDSPRHLELHFVRDVAKHKIVDAYRESFNKMAGDQKKEMKPKIEKLLGWMVAAKDGKSQIYTYIPGEGLTVKVHGQTKGTIKGADFAEAFFKIWLGPSPPNAGLKRGLLGGTCG